MWQWIKHGATLQPGNKPLTKEGFEAALKDELAALRKEARFWSRLWRHRRTLPAVSKERFQSGCSHGVLCASRRGIYVGIISRR